MTAFIKINNHKRLIAMRKKLQKADNIYADYNPNADFYAQEEIIPREDCDYIKLTFEDNEYLKDSERDEILRYKELGYDIEGNIINKYWANLWKVYGLGLSGSLQGVVFEDWETVEEIPEDASLQGYGIDFGFSQSPFTMVAVYKMDGAYYFDEIIYQTNLTNQQTAELMIEREVDQGAIMYADYAEPKSIRELQHEGINIEPCDSKGDIREYAIRKIQGSTFYVTEDSENMIDNLQNYVWATDKTGKSTGKPKKTDDHTLDAIIYFIGTDDKYSGEY